MDAESAAGEYPFAAAVRALVDSAPPLSAEIRAKLAILLRPAPSELRRSA